REPSCVVGAHHPSPATKSAAGNGRTERVLQESAYSGAAARFEPLTERKFLAGKSRRQPNPDTGGVNQPGPQGLVGKQLHFGLLQRDIAEILPEVFDELHLRSEQFGRILDRMRDEIALCGAEHIVEGP